MNLLIHLEYYNKNTRLGGLNNKHLFLMVLEAGMFKIKALADPMSGEGPVPGLQMTVLAASPHGRGGKRALGVFFVRALISLMGAPPSCLNHPPKAPPPNTITWGN